jgi:molybdopterin-guanine dinucleotide biosynthesis protein B
MSFANARVPILGFAAYSGTGKTTLLRKLLPLLRARGLRIAVIKHAHHTFDTDVPGKDSYELRRAGAAQMLVTSRHRWALVTETGDTGEPRLEELLGHLSQDALDLILVEGFKAEPIPKIELHRPSCGHPLMCLTDRSIIALATDQPPATPLHIPVFDLGQPEALAAFILETIRSGQANAATRVQSAGNPERDIPVSGPSTSSGSRSH